MKRILLASAMVLAAVPTVSQAANSDANLDCAIWASVRMDESTDPQTVNGLGFVLSWFIGLYEGQTGASIDDAMVARSAEMTDAQFDMLDQTCLPRMQGFGSRLSGLAQRLEAQGN